MFRDASEELERLQAELLAEEEPAEETSQEPPEEDELYEEYEEYEEYEDTRPAQGPAVYQNYSNDYGKSLRNYASGYRAYNSDTSDEDLDEYSEEVRSGGKKRGGCCLAVIACILALVLAGLVLLLAYVMGYIG